MSGSTLLETPEGDWDLSARGLTLTRDLPTYTAQKLRGRLQFFRGEWFLDQRIGFPWNQSVFSIKNPDLRSIRQLLRRTILSVPSVENVDRAEASLDAASRVLSLSFAARLNDGSTLLAGEGTPFLLQIEVQ